MRGTVTFMHGEEGIRYSSALKEEWSKTKVPAEPSELFLMPSCQQVLNGSQHVMW